MRDYIHVIDLARAHVDALDYLVRADRSLTVNLGTGRGVSVLELVRAFERAVGPRRSVRDRRSPARRRRGRCTPIPRWRSALLGWRAELDVDAMCRDAWRWQSMNPDGYRALERVRRIPAIRHRRRGTSPRPDAGASPDDGLTDPRRRRAAAARQQHAPDLQGRDDQEHQERHAHADAWTTWASGPAASGCEGGTRVAVSVMAGIMWKNSVIE